MYLNANIPIIECYVRGNYLRDQKDSFDKYFGCNIFGFSSIPNQVPLFHFMMEDGGLWWRAPISAFCKEPNVKELPLNELDFGYAEKPDQHKCGHVLQLDNGNYAIQPNNRLRVFDASMGTDLDKKPVINRLVNTKRWPVETSSKWITDEHEEGSYDYHFKELKND